MKMLCRIILIFFTIVLLVGLVQAAVFAAEPTVMQNEDIIEPKETVGLLQDLTPQYGSNGKFLAPIEPPTTGSIAIRSREELIKIGNEPAYPLSGSYHLTADIDLNPALYGGAEWVPIGKDETNSFAGTFDGQGHVIHNITITGNRKYAGLFGYISNATIKSIGIEGTYINMYSLIDSYSGGICGYFDSGSINNCYNTGAISSTTTTTSSLYSSFAGGICGYSNNLGYINNCYNTGAVSTTTTTTTTSSSSLYYYCCAGGICGYSIRGSINNCYNTGVVSSSSPTSSYAGGICGYSILGSINNCYNTGDATSSYAGGICGLSSSYDGYSEVCSINNCYWNINSVQKVNGVERLNADKVGVGLGEYTGTTTSLKTEEMQNVAFVNLLNANKGDNLSWYFDTHGINQGYPTFTSNNMKVTIKNTIGIAGDEVYVPIVIENNSGIAGFRFQIHFDNNRLTPVSIIQGDLLTVGTITSNLSNGDDFIERDYVSALWYNPTEISGDGTLYTVVFKIADMEGPWKTPLVLSYRLGDVTNQKLENLNPEIMQGEVEVVALVFGDIFGDGVINVKDIVRLAQYLAEFPSAQLSYAELRAADVYADGVVDTRDAVLLTQYLAHWPVVLGK